jgi:hypothetical protein
MCVCVALPCPALPRSLAHPQVLEQLRKMYGEMDDELEGVV